MTTFCNEAHRLVDGKPIEHECYVLPTEALNAERAGDTGRALEVLSAWKKRKAHRGLRRKLTLVNGGESCLIQQGTHSKA